MAGNKLAALRELQKSLNEEIENYEKLANAGDASGFALAAAEAKINSIAQEAVVQTTNPTFGAVEFGFAVSISRSHCGAWCPLLIGSPCSRQCVLPLN